MKKKIKIAIAYDFDGTLAPGYMQDHSFIPEIGIKNPAKNFWPKVKQAAAKHDMDEILAYMHQMLSEARNHGQERQITKKAFKNAGKKIRLFPGVISWFNRINKYAKSKNIILEHYIISSGNREIILGTKVAREFEYIFASGFMYDGNNVAVWPALAVNYTNKTQYLFRINKGIKNSYDNKAINRYMPEGERPIPFKHIIYMGDGETDVPTMKMVKYQNGYAIAVYDPKKRTSKKGRKTPKQIALQLLDENRADYAVPADYTQGSRLEDLVKLIIDKIYTANEIKKLEK